MTGCLYQQFYLVLKILINKIRKILEMKSIQSKKKFTKPPLMAQAGLFVENLYRKLIITKLIRAFSNVIRNKISI